MTGPECATRLQGFKATDAALLEQNREKNVQVGAGKLRARELPIDFACIKVTLYLSSISHQTL